MAAYSAAPPATTAAAPPAPHLTPAPNAIGIYPQFFAQQSESLVLKEKVLSLSGDSFGIKTVDGRVLFQVKGEVMSLSGRKHFMDANGALLFDIRKQHLSFPACYYAEDPNGKRIFDVKSKFKLLGSKAICSFVGASGKTEQLIMEGNFLDSRAEIKNEAGNVVATIDRKFFNAAELIGGQQTYVVTVAPGIDMAVLAAMCICLDEKRNEK